MSSNFNWNDTIEKMNKNNSLKSLLRKLMILWAKNGGVKVCLLYSALNTVGFSDFKTIIELEHYIDNINIDMIYIKTNHGEWQVYLDKYDTYRFEYRKRYKILKIIQFDGEIDIKI